MFDTHTWLAPIGYDKVVRLKYILLHNKDPDMDSLLDVCFSPAAHISMVRTPLEKQRHHSCHQQQ